MPPFLPELAYCAAGYGGYGKSIGSAQADYSNFGKKYEIRIFPPGGHIYIPKDSERLLAVPDVRCLFMEKILNLLMRAILGTIAMYFINSALNRLGVPLGVGINAATVLTSGILGFPGLLALYGIGIYRIL